MLSNDLLFSKHDYIADTSPKNIINLLLGVDNDEHGTFVSFDIESNDELSQLEILQTFRQFAAAYQFDVELMVHSLEDYISNEISKKGLQNLLSFLNKEYLYNQNCYLEENNNEELNFEFDSDLLAYVRDFNATLSADFTEGMPGNITGAMDMFYIPLPSNALNDLKTNYRGQNGEFIEPEKLFSRETTKEILQNHYDEICTLNTKIIMASIYSFLNELVGHFNEGLSNKEIFDWYRADNLLTNQETVSHRPTPSK